MYIDSIECFARALVEWDLNLEDAGTATERFGDGLSDCQVSVDSKWRQREDQAVSLLASLVQPHGTTDSALVHLAEKLWNSWIANIEEHTP